MWRNVLIFILILLAGIFLYLRLDRDKRIKTIRQINSDTMTTTSKTENEKLSIITVFDNYRADPLLKTGWGFSCLIRRIRPIGEKSGSLKEENILLDTGADSDILLSNMKKLNIIPETIDFIFISHLHDDHIGGLNGILKIRPDLTVYKPELFPKEKEIIEDVYTTGSLGNDIKEQSLIIKSEKGLIIITGCAHPGIVNILEKAKEMFPSENIYLVLGGFHLEDELYPELKSIISDFRKLNVQKAALCHCSGERTRELFKKEYGDNYIENGVGKVINIE